MPHTHRSLCHAGPAALEQALREGVRPDLESLAGWEFRGYNTPFFTRILGIRKFKKGFYRTSGTPAGVLEGYNVRTRQSGFDEPWVDVLRKGEPVRHGFYRVVPPSGADNLYPRALLLDYSQGQNPFYDPSRLLRDYLVQVNPEDPDLLLGKAYVALGPKRVHVSYFVLLRDAPSPLQQRQTT